MAKYEIKVQVTGADQAAAEINKDTAALKKNQDQAAQTTQSTEKLGVSKRGLLDALKKLKNELPVFGALVDSLKNPYAAVTLAISAAIGATRAYTQAIKEQAQEQAGLEALNTTQLTFFTNTAKARVEAAAFRAELAAIGTEAKSATEYLKQANAEAAKMFPEGGRAKDVAEVTNLGNARRREQERAAKAEAALPAAEATLKAAEEKLLVEQRNQTLAGSVDPKKREKAVAELAVVSERLLDPIITKGPSGKVVYDSRTKDTVRQQELLDTISGIDRAADARGSILTAAQGDVSAAQNTVSRLRKEVVAGTTGAAQFGRDERAAAALADQGLVRAPGSGIGPGSLQYRYDAQVAAGGERIKDFELQQQTLNSIDRFTNSVLKRFEEADRKLNAQSQNTQ